MALRWLDEARKYLGLKEMKGPKHAQAILDMWKAIKRGGIKDDETPWCAAFVGACLERVGILSTRFESAKSYLSWGENWSALCWAVWWSSPVTGVAMWGSWWASPPPATCWSWVATKGMR